MRWLVSLLTSFVFCLGVNAQQEPVLPTDTVYADSLSEYMINATMQYKSGVQVGFVGGHHMYAELGFYWAHLTEYNGFLFFTQQYTLGAEYSYLGGPMLAPKFTYRTQGIFGQFSGTLLYYTDFEGGSSLSIRPEFGFALPQFELLYGYQWNIKNGDIGNLNTHSIILRYNIDFWKKVKAERYSGEINGWYLTHPNGVLTPMEIN